MMRILADTTIVNVCAEETPLAAYVILGIMAVGVFSFLGFVIWDTVRS